MNFDEALAAILALNGKRIEVSIFDSGDVPHLVASLAGVLRGAYSITGGEPSEGEGIFVRIQCGDEAASLSLDRELFTAGQLHEDGTLALRLGTAEIMLTPRPPTEQRPAGPSRGRRR